jgi:2-oxoglutarate dehydrogenase E2 component (dihydrolipoamide succinyltransferase)
MSSTEDVSPLGTTPTDAAVAPAAADAENAASASVEAAPSPSDALSPAVRRLVRQFDLDVTGIHGTGPAGRIRVGDVMGLLGGRTDSGNRDAPARPNTPEGDLDDAAETAAPARPRPAAAEAPAHDVVPTSTVFDCDLSRVLAHRRKLRLENAELLTTSYFLTALAAALDAAPEITTREPPRFGVWLTTVDGERRSSFLDAPSVLPEAALDERVRAIDAALRTNLDADVAPANLLVHHYGESGSLVATPTPIGIGHAASVGIGRVRREIVVRSVDGVESPRVAACCYLTLSFFTDRVTLHHANRVLALAVRLLEQWPE